MENESREQQKAALIAEITVAFDGVAREDGVTLHEAQALDDYADDEERAEARALDTEIRWQDVPAEDITLGNNVLSFLDSEGFRYYIPAYLIWYLTAEEDCSTYDSIIFFLASDYEAEGSRHCLPRVSLLTPEQSRAIAHFCVFAAEDEEQANVEGEEMLDGWVADGQMTQAKRDAGREASRQFRLEHDMPDSYFKRALDRWWGRFL